MNAKEDFWKDAVVVDTYTRKQAIEDGELADVSEVGKEFGFKYPIAVTSALWNIIEKSAKVTGVTWDWIMWDILTMMNFTIQRQESSDTCYFAFSAVLEEDKEGELIEVWSLINGGDDGKPVITIMLRGED